MATFKNAGGKRVLVSMLAQKHIHGMFFLKRFSQIVRLTCLNVAKF